jgi:hypothetical protein
VKHHPFPAALLFATAGDAVVRPERLPELLSVVQADLSLRVDEYREHHECAYEDDRLVAFFVAGDHWTSIADRLGLETSAVDATRSAHARFLLGLGADAGRAREFENALDVQDCVVIEKTAA